MASLTEADTQRKTNYMVVGAIDFGTSYSGYAYSFTHDPQRVIVGHWPCTTQSYIMEKTPTCILFDKNKIFSKFGFEAEDEYRERCDEGNEADWYFFKGFKLNLYNEMCLTEDKKILDDQKREFPLLDVVCETLRYLNDTMVEDYKKKVYTFEENDMLRVITVPAIWSDSARNFMKKAALKAGIAEHLLNICLEPEAAAIYCKTVPCKTQRQESKSELVTFKPGDQYLVLDAGGGTVDIVVHEVEESGGIKELHPACGGDWGGTRVDKAFSDYLSSCLGKEVFNEFRQQARYDYMDVMRHFEIKKRSVVLESDKNKALVLRLPPSLLTIYKDKRQNKSNAENFELNTDKMRVSYGTYLNFHSDSKKEIGNKLYDILANPSLENVKTIVMVGGYSDSRILQSFIVENFPQSKIIIPEDAAVAVLKGAAMFGHDPTVISERRCRCTYGIQISKLFDETIDQESRKFIDDDGNIRARDSFDVHVTVGQNVKTGVFQTSRVYIPLKRAQKRITLPLYASSNARPTYTDESGCKEINTRSVDISDLKGSLSEKAIRVSLCFGGPLITVKAVKKQTGEEISNKIEYQWSEKLERQAEIGTSERGVSKEIAVCAIKIGTISSSFAVSFKHDLKSVYSKLWHQYGSIDDRILNCILFDQNKRFRAFGDEAERLYNERKEDTSTDWFYFKDYTRALYDNKPLKTGLKIKDEQGRPFPLLTVVSETVSYIARHPNIYFGLGTDMDMVMIPDTGVPFVFLTNSGLTESARSFLNDAVEKAGIPKEKLRFCPELEAAVSYCRIYLSMQFEQNKEYLVLLSEGDRVDFEVFSVDAAGNPTGVCNLGGGNWGSTMVCNQFINFLYEIFGKNAIDGLTQQDSYELLRKFRKKMSVSPLSDEQARIMIPVPGCLIDDRCRSLTKEGTPSGIRFIADKMGLTHKKMLQFHEKSLETIGNHLAKIFAIPAHKDISTMIMIGDYAEYPNLQDYIARRFSSKKLFVPEHASEALLKGAIQYGIRKSILA